MQHLHLVGFTSERDGLIFSARRGSRSGGFVVSLDERLLESIRELLRSQPGAGGEVAAEGLGGAPALEPRRVPQVRSSLSPRDIQARLRAGRTVSEVAAEAGVDEAWIRRFASPVLAEQARVVSKALTRPCRANRKGLSAMPLGESVALNVVERTKPMTRDEFDDGWSAYHVHESSWVVRFSYRSRRGMQVAQWGLDLSDDSLVPLNRLGTELGFVEPGRRRRKFVLPEVLPPDERGATTLDVARAEAAGTGPVGSSLEWDADPFRDTAETDNGVGAAGLASRTSRRRPATTARPRTAARAAGVRKVAGRRTAVQRKAAPARKALAARKATSARKATTARPAAARKAVAARKVAAARKAVAARKVAVSRKATTARTGAARKTTPARKATPARKVAGARKATPATRVRKTTKAATTRATTKATAVRKAPGRRAVAPRGAGAKKVAAPKSATKRTSRPTGSAGRAGGAHAARGTAGAAKRAPASGSGGRQVARPARRRAVSVTTPAPTSRTAQTTPVPAPAVRRARPLLAERRPRPLTPLPRRNGASPAESGNGRPSTGPAGDVPIASSPVTPPPAAPAVDAGFSVDALPSTVAPPTVVAAPGVDSSTPAPLDTLPGVTPRPHLVIQADRAGQAPRSS